jgi:hypothetical protein
MPNEFPVTKLRKIPPPKPDCDPAGVGAWNAVLEMETIPVATELQSIRGVILQSDDLLIESNSVIPPSNMRMRQELGLDNSRFALYAGVIEKSGTSGDLPAVVELEIRFGSRGAASPVFTGIWTPKGFGQDGPEFIVQISGRLHTQVEIWARVHPVGFRVTAPFRIAFHVHGDRQSGGVFFVDPGPNTV